MKSFEKKYLVNFKFSAEAVTSMRVIGEYKGKEDLYKRQSPDALEKLLESAIIQSAESSNRIEGITAPAKRIEKIVKGQVQPSDRSEQEIAGYKDVLNLIHQSHSDIPLSENVVLQFHSMLYRHTGKRAGFWKLSENEITEEKPDGSVHVRFKTTPAKDTPDYMRKLIALYNEYSEKETYDPLVLIPLFILDFLCIHPFPDGNGRAARLLTLMLLYKAGYKVGKYISLERIIEESKESYYDSLFKSSQGWHSGKHNAMPWLNYFSGVLIAGYQDFEKRVGVFKGKGSKTDQVVAAVERFVMPFSIVDIEKICPNVSRDMVRKILRDLRDKGVINPSSMGRGARWIKSR